MKQILLILSLLMATTASAQVAELQGYKTVSVGDEVVTMDQIIPETQWYAVFQQRDGGGYWWAAPAEYNASKSYVENTVCLSNGTDILASPSSTSSVSAYVVRFLYTETEDAYIVQFGNGTYMRSVGNNKPVKYTDNLAEAATVRMYNIVTTDNAGTETVNAGHWGFNFTNNDVRIDNNGPGNSVAGWESGTITSVGGNNDHRIFAVDITELSELQFAKVKTKKVYEKYIAYSGSFNDKVEANVPGHYDAALVEVFENALVEAEALNTSESDGWTVEQIEMVAKNIEDAYQAVLDSRNPLSVTVTDGFYLIQTPPFFYETVDEDTTYLSKGLCAKLSGENVFAAWDSYDETSADRAAFLWRVISKGDKKYELKNMGYEVNAAYWTSDRKLLLNEGDSTVMFDYNSYRDEEGNSYYNIRLSNSPERDNYYIHCTNGNDGAGTDGWIVKWSAGEGGASEWKMIPVTEEEAQVMVEAFSPIRNKKEAKAILADVEEKLLIAEDNEPLITAASQLSSPYSEDPKHESGNDLANLIDGDANTYWHTQWISGQVAGGTHYLQVELADPSAVSEVVYKMTRRAVQNDHPTVISVYGTNDSEAEKDACTLLGTVNTPFGNNTETVISRGVPTQGFTYLRFYGDEMAPDTRGYWHAAEFQLYAAETIINETSQAVAMGDVFTNMKTAVEQAKLELEGDAITSNTYNELLVAYEAFIAMYVNPDTLRNKIAAVEGIENNIVIGSNPGQWNDDTPAAGIILAVADAKAYDESGAYTQADSRAHIAALDAAKEAMVNAANKIQEGKWYQFQFAPEALYDQNGWDKATAAELFDRRVVYRYRFAGNSLDFYSPGSLSDEEQDRTKFRFVEIGDSAYVIQHKASGLYLYTAALGDFVTLQPAATTWKAGPMGCGKVMLTGHNPNGDYVGHLHASSYGSLETSELDDVASNTGFMITEAEDVEPDYDGTRFYLDIPSNSISSYCFPVDITAVDGDLYGVSVEGTEITLTKMENKTAKAGEPFVYINGTPNLYNDDVFTSQKISFIHGDNLVALPQHKGQHKGTFNDTTVGQGNILIKPNGMEVAKESYNNIRAFRSYIAAELSFNSVLAVKLDGVDLFYPAPTFVVNDMVACQGKSFVLPVAIQNKQDITSLQFDVYLPAGVDFVTEQNYAVRMSSDRTTSSHALTTSLLEDGGLHVVVSSVANKAFMKNEGTIVNIPLQLSNDIEPGDYRIRLRNIRMTEPTAKEHQTNWYMSKLTVQDYLDGDANGDGNVSIPDIVAMVSAMMGQNPDDFNLVAADINKDGEIGIGDIVSVVDIVLSGTSSNLVRATRSASTDFVSLSSAAVTGDALSVPVVLTNAQAYSAFQMDVTLPHGSTLTSVDLSTRASSSHTVVYRMLTANKIRVVAYSLNNATFSGNVGELLTLNINGTNQSHGICVENVRFVTPEGVEEILCGEDALDGVSSQMEVSVLDGRLHISSPVACQLSVYNIDGQLVRKLDVMCGSNQYTGFAAGTYIVNGVKVIIK